MYNFLTSGACGYYPFLKGVSEITQKSQEEKVQTVITRERERERGVRQDLQFVQYCLKYINKINGKLVQIEEFIHSFYLFLYCDLHKMNKSKWERERLKLKVYGTEKCKYIRTLVPLNRYVHR